MTKLITIFFFLICALCYSQSEITADWDINIEGNEVTLSIIEFNNFTVGLDGHWHYILDDNEYVAVHDINDVLITDLSNGNHIIHVWLVDHMHNALDPPVEETIEFTINSELSLIDNKKLEVMVYPNPVYGKYVTISTSNTGSKTIQLFNTMGEKVLETILNGKILNIERLSSGIYILKISVIGKSRLIKLVIK